MRVLVVPVALLALCGPRAVRADEPGEALAAARALIDAGRAAEAARRLQALESARSDPRVGHL